MHIRFSTTLFATAAAAAVLSLTTPALALDVATVKPQLEAEISADYPHLFDIYKDIHQHPELGHQKRAPPRNSRARCARSALK